MTHYPILNDDDLVADGYLTEAELKAAVERYHRLRSEREDDEPDQE